MAQGNAERQHQDGQEQHQGAADLVAQLHGHDLHCMRDASVTLYRWRHNDGHFVYYRLNPARVWP
ncbi:MAG: hypothetical protein MUE63_15030, partial [Xanthomonadales bacterium]|nr:hypothetical protein [Xanthomonadales bacterium]